MSRNDFLWGYYAPRTSRPAEAAKGIARRETSEDNQSLLEGNLTFDKTFVEKHKVNAVVGYSFQEFFNEGFSAQNREFVTDLFTYNNLGAGNNLLPGDISSQKNSNRLISFYGRANYSYDSKYMLTATLRRDGSSKFGANNRWGYFPSVSAAWRISQEKFMNRFNFVEDLKLRVSYGVTGNQDIPNYKTLAMYGTGGYYYSNGQFYTQYTPNQNANPDLKW
jgi:iron complex outermembrane receptor protein